MPHDCLSLLNVSLKVPNVTTNYAGCKLGIQADKPLLQPPSKARPFRRLSDPPKQRVTSNNKQLSMKLEKSSEEESKLICSYDDEEYRYVNPLLELPPLPGLRISNMPYDYYCNFLQSIGAGASYHGEPMHASEFWNLSQIYFPRPDTFPLRYLARLLGFELKYRQKQELRHRRNIQGNDSTAIVVETESNDVLQLEPEAQNVCPIEKQLEVSGCTSNEPAEQVDESTFRLFNLELLLL